MARKLICVTVRGKRHTWGFTFSDDPKHLEEWRADGLDVYVIENIVPAWVPSRLRRTWCVVQDIINFKNPWRTNGR